MTADQPADGYLFELYRRYIGEPDDRADVYLGFGVFLSGIGLGAAALILFLYGSTFETRSAAYLTWTEPAYAMALLSLPLLMLGIVVLLPSERRVQYTSVAGVAITALAVVGFLYAYPADWNGYGNDYTAEVVAVYAVGLAGLTASTGAALIAHYLDMARTVEAIESEDEEAESYSDEEIRQDIDDAMQDVELSWGGVQKTEHRRLEFSESEFDEVHVGEAATTTRSSGVDAQVAGLKGLKGGDKKTTTSSSTVDDQTAKLRELREKQRAEAAEGPDGAAAVARGWLSSVATRVRSLVSKN
ncbi:permease [Halobacteria archaeon AArc-dxtr1]|nr:permease [Halobacteria archaeon AArc-dxtr1]